MDIITKYLNKIAYKFPKGYPDMNNKQDILILENELNKLGIPFVLKETLSPEAQKAKEILKKNFDLDDKNFLEITSTQFKVLMDASERSDFLNKAKELDDFEFELKGSSIGRLKYQPENQNKAILIYAKPISMQGLGSAGKRNEADFNNLINSHIEKNNNNPITVIFKGSGKTLKYENVAEAVDASISGATEFDKSDTDLLDPSKNIIVGISLKKQNAVRWESSKRRPIGDVNVFKSFIDKVGKIGTEDEVGEFENVVLNPLEQKGKYRLTNPKTGQTLSKVIVKNTPSSVIKNVIFGDNNDKKTIVIKETFEGGFNNYSYDESNATLVINCYKIYTDVNDLINTDDEPVFAFSNHIGQAYGIEFRSFSKGALYKENELRGSSTEIDFNDLK